MTTETPTKPFDPVVRQRALDAIAAGMSVSEMARGAVITKSIVVQYLNPAGNCYPGNIELYERRIAYFLERRNEELLAGIKTIETGITRQVESLVKAVRRQRVIGKGIGPAGIGKTRSVLHLTADAGNLAYFVSQQTGTREAVRRALFKMFGIRGGKKTYGSSNLAKYEELVKRIRESDSVFLFDQAHMLSVPAMHFLCELWNETRRPQLWLGTEKLIDKLERDEQIASRVEFGDALKTDKDAARALIQHQIKSMLPEINGEMGTLTKLFEGLAAGTGFRRVEMRLGNMLYLSELDGCRGKTWQELFEAAAAIRNDAFSDN